MWTQTLCDNRSLSAPTSHLGTKSGPRLADLHFRTRLGFGLAYMFRLKVRITHVAFMVRVSIQRPQPWVCMFVCIQVLHVITVAPDSQLEPDQPGRDLPPLRHTFCSPEHYHLLCLKFISLLRAHIHTQTNTHTLTHWIQHQQTLT